MINDNDPNNSTTSPDGGTNEPTAGTSGITHTLPGQDAETNTQPNMPNVTQNARPAVTIISRPTDQPSTAMLTVGTPGTELTATVEGHDGATGGSCTDTSSGD